MTTNIRYLYSNLIDMSSTALEASSQAESMPVENILNPLKCIPWRTLGTEFEYVDIDLSQVYLVQAFAVAGHNYTSQARLILCGDDSGSFYQAIDSNHTGFWKFNGDCSDSSSSANNLTGVGIDGDSYIQALQDRAILLDGTGDYCTIAQADAGDYDFGQSQDFSIEIRIKPSSIAEAGLVSKWNGTNGFYVEMTSEGRIHFKASDGTNSDEISGTTALQADTWYLISITADRDGQLRLYLNGNEDAAAVSMTTGNLSSTADFFIGKHNTTFLSGLVALAAVSNTARSAEYVLDSYETPKIVKEVSYSDGCLIECFDSQSQRYWRYIISDPENADGYLDTGRLYLGEWFEPTRNFQGNWTRKIVDPSSITATLNNIEFSDIRDKYITLDLNFPKEVQIPQNDAEQYEDMFSYLGTHKRLFIALDYENQPHKWTYYGTLTGDRLLSHLSGTSHTDGRWTLGTLKFKESR